jgi:NAD kinase
MDLLLQRQPANSILINVGGPVVTPNVSGLVITPIASHNLTVRPVVVPMMLK